MLVVGRQRGQQVKTGHAERMNHTVSTPGEHRLGIAATDDLGGLTDGLARSRTGSQTVEVWPLSVEQIRQMARGHVRLLFQLGLRVELL